MPVKSRKYKGFKVFYKNDFETEFLLKEIFEEDCYQFTADNNSPFIIDCGAHIGISIIYFKHIYPASRIIAFEPDKNSFELLQKNISVNNLKDVALHNSAISDFEGEAIMYGDFRQNSESVGNTLIKNWGARSGFTTSKVMVVKLAETIKNETIDYLKIDTEGTELAILKNIEEYLAQIKNICVEFHEYDNNRHEVLEISDLLEKKNFHVSTEMVNLEDVLSEKYPLWVNNRKPAVHIIKGKLEK